ncbi:hypothetical protein H5410_040815, partial [Solanum commersonii]
MKKHLRHPSGFTSLNFHGTITIGVKVKVDLAKPLRDFVWIGVKNEDGVERAGFKQMVEYDYVPGYCFICKHQGHFENQCLKRFSNVDANKIEGK